uniref:NADH-ubiquinone oxidoreductase chain 2 n=1 Tax=Palaemon serenus TaxID=117983 RepID=A0A0U2DW87_9EUCA|nr:NADH dehydrogenase subunit 2 [Palaemon serenus]AKQ09496.1 NADH dehydrogenase subunit 2 [Palaemon serenus]
MLMLSPSLLLFSTTLVAGTLIATSSSSWFVAWLGLELNLLSFIPLVSSSYNTFSSEAALKYFLVQALGSATLLASVTMLLMFTDPPKILILGSLILKMGAAPLHFWLPPVMQGMSWPNCFVLMTVQKIAPIVLMSYVLCPYTSPILVGASVSSAVMGGLGGLNQTLLRKLMAYSSINHLSWMLAALSCSSSLWVHYILTYTVISLSLVILFNYNQVFHIKHFASFSSSQFNKTMVFLSLFSLGGLPPFLGFLPKMTVVKDLASQGFLLWAFILMMSALITLFYYVRISLTALTLASPKTASDLAHVSHKPASAALINLIPLFFPLMMLVPF